MRSTEIETVVRRRDGALERAHQSQRSAAAATRRAQETASRKDYERLETREAMHHDAADLHLRAAELQQRHLDHLTTPPRPRRGRGSSRRRDD